MSAGSTSGDAAGGAVAITGVWTPNGDGGNILGPQAGAQRFPLQPVSATEQEQIDRFGIFGDDRG